MTKLKTPSILLLLFISLVIPVGVIAIGSTEVEVASPEIVHPIISESISITAAENYLPRPELVDLPVQPITYVTKNGIVVLAPENTIYAEFAGLPSSEILNKLVELVEARDVRWGFAACTSENLSNTFLPFNEYLKIRFTDDYDTAMVIVDSKELGTKLNPWGIQISFQGRLEMAEELLVGEMLMSVLSGDMGLCWGSSDASEMIIYGNIQSLFDRLIAKYTIEY